MNALKKLRAASPVKTGKYKKRLEKKRWSTREKRTSESAFYNAKYPGLTHLAGKGATPKVNGGRVAAIPHIEPAEQHAAKKLVNKVKVKIR